MYVAVKGGEKAIENAHRLLAHERRGDTAIPELSLEQIQQQLTLAVDRVSRGEQLLVLKSVRVSSFSRRFTRVSDRALLLGVHHLRHLG